MFSRLGFHFGAWKNVKLQQTQFYIKDTGKSSSRKLRRAIYYILYRTDPQKTHYKISFSANMSKNKKENISPPHSYRLKAGPICIYAQAYIKNDPKHPKIWEIAKYAHSLTPHFYRLNAGLMSEWGVSPHAVISSLGAMGGGAGGREKFRVVVARPGPGLGSALPLGNKM